LTPEQEAVRDLAAQVLADLSTPTALRELDRAGGDRVDRRTWRALAEAGLLGTVVPEEHGGAGLGVLELCLLLEEVGRRTAAVPALATLALGALPVARFGSPALRERLLPGVVAGTTVLSAALVEPLGDPRRSTLSATADGDAW